MKVLYITFLQPSDFFGGGLVIKQSILSISKKFDIDYIGPEILDDEVKSNVNPIVTLKHNSNFIYRTINLMRGITTGFYESWIKERDNIRWEDYEVIFLEFSRFDFITEYVKQKNKKIIVRVHNVEQDYYSNIKKSKKNIQNFLRYKYICRQEPKCLKYADCIITLTKNDKERLIQLYPNSVKNNKIKIIPVCVKQPLKDETDLMQVENGHIDSNYILITGSLWYGPNSDGVIWFIENVWSRLQQMSTVQKHNYKLVLAGSRPNDQIKDNIIKYDNIELIDSPKDMSVYFRKANIYVAPIFTGAGMKVKIAEALSYGLTIIGTTHAFIGYDIKNRKNGYVADTSEQFVSAIEEYVNMAEENKCKMKDEIEKIYLRKYSTNNSEKRFEEIIDNLFSESAR